jgi:glycine dehydrogenase subunit 1
MAFIPHTPADVEAMLAAIGVASIEDLFDEIPPTVMLHRGRGLRAPYSGSGVGDHDSR